MKIFAISDLGLGTQFVKTNGLVMQKFKSQRSISVIKDSDQRKSVGFTVLFKDNQPSWFWIHLDNKIFENSLENKREEI